MAHLITSTDGAIYSSRAWHGHGTVDPDLQTLPAREVFRRAGILWSPVLCPLVALGVGPLDGADLQVPTEPSRIVDRDGSEVPGGEPCAVAVRRSDSGALLGVVGSKYEPLGPLALAEILEAANLRLVNALTLRGGRDVLATVRGDTFGVNTACGVDTVETYTSFVDSTEGSRKFLGLSLDFRPDCANMLARALQVGTVAIKARHTAKAMADAVAALQATLEADARSLPERKALAQALANRALTAQERRAYWVSVWEAATQARYPVNPATEAERKRALACEATLADLQAALDAPDTARADRGSAWGAFQAVTRWTTHTRTVRRGAQGATEAEARTYASLLGTSAAVAAKAENLARALVGAQ